MEKLNIQSLLTKQDHLLHFQFSKGKINLTEDASRRWEVAFRERAEDHHRLLDLLLNQRLLRVLKNLQKLYTNKEGKRYISCLHVGISIVYLVYMTSAV